MITRLQKMKDEREGGFTLIELLVVIIIIGILAAIAIPVFLNQRKGAVTATMESDLRNAAIAVEAAYTTDGAYPATGTALSTLNVATSDGGTTLTYTAATGTEGPWCIQASNTGASETDIAVATNMSTPTAGTCAAGVFTAAA